ncbi:PE cleavage protein A-like [Zingiber officinale]|uniref:PE cleavage protein A-like n=1 Tax=Zingiber officinale TaxID=94328 RepID=UPI001C4B3528|nr:PE cleavage protein A-like [Zingiber officinale]
MGTQGLLQTMPELGREMRSLAEVEVLALPAAAASGQEPTTEVVLETVPEVDVRDVTDTVLVAEAASGTEPVVGVANTGLGVEAAADTGSHNRTLWYHEGTGMLLFIHAISSSCRGSYPLLAMRRLGSLPSSMSPRLTELNSIASTSEADQMPQKYPDLADCDHSAVVRSPDWATLRSVSPWNSVNRLFIDSANAGIRARAATISGRWVGIVAGTSGIPEAGGAGGGIVNGATGTAGTGAGYIIGTGGTGGASARYMVGPGGDGAGYTAGSAGGGIGFAMGGTVCTVWVGTSNEAIGV